MEAGIVPETTLLMSVAEGRRRTASAVPSLPKLLVALAFAVPLLWGLPRGGVWEAPSKLKSSGSEGEGGSDDKFSPVPVNAMQMTRTVVRMLAIYAMALPPRRRGGEFGAENSVD